jgi:hypothetical protein
MTWSKSTDAAFENLRALRLCGETIKELARIKQAIAHMAEAGRYARSKTIARAGCIAARRYRAAARYVPGRN